MYSVQFKSIVDGCKNAKQHAATPAIVFFFLKKNSLSNYSSTAHKINVPALLFRTHPWTTHAHAEIYAHANNSLVLASWPRHWKCHW
jgi:hypothetical protein